MASPVPHNPVRQAANSIMGNDLNPKTPPMPDSLESPKAGTKHPFHSIRVKGQTDGSILVEHEKPRTPKGDGEDSFDDYENRTVASTHATPEAAHAHIGKLMGVGGHSGAQHLAGGPPHIPAGK